ncbi:MAG: cadherin-like domain-containing protein [Xanthobacteraceae bacterium]|nr:cadherin-like domain-containing protein [Xanthobacteraceae bacterium]
MAKPIQGTPQNNNPIVGTSKSDKIQGKGGDDVIIGGRGDDSIDGGKGFDTAVFSGSFFDYAISIKGTGNDKVTVTDLVADRDGTDSLKQVEALQFQDVTIRLDQNNAAITRADSAGTDEDHSVTINVLSNDADFEGHALGITQVDGQAISVGGTVVLASGATVTLNANQTLTYDPANAFQGLNGGETGNDSFTYTVTDSQGAVSSPATVSLAIDGAWEAPTYTVNGTLDESAQKPATNDMIVGSGIPASGFGLAHADDAGIELGLQVIYRQGPTVTTADDYADGVLKFAVNDGPQSTANGSSANNAGRASWSFEYSIATGLNGETTSLDDFKFKLLIDTDPTAAINYKTLVLEPEGTPQPANQSGFQWRDADTHLVAIADDAGNANVTQNSQNYAFYGLPGYNAGTGFAGPGEFDIVLQAYDSSDTLIAQNHIQVDVLV